MYLKRYSIHPINILLFVTSIASFSCNNINKNEADVFNPADTINIVSDGIKTIGVYNDDGAHPTCVMAAIKMFEWMDCNVKKIYANDINGYNIADIDVFYFPGGSTGPYQTELTPEGKTYIRYMVERGCGFIGTCAGAIFACETMLWENVSSTTSQLGIVPAIAYGPNSEIFEYPEYGMAKLNYEPNTITTSQPDTGWIMYYNGPFYSITDEDAVQVIARFDINNQPAILACNYGNGRVYITSPHPEWEEDSNRDGVSYFDGFEDRGSDWDMMKNAVDWIFGNIEY